MDEPEAFAMPLLDVPAKGDALLCVRHIVEWQTADVPITRDELFMGEAITVFRGEALCTRHLNTVRGREPEYRPVMVEQ